MSVLLTTMMKSSQASGRQIKAVAQMLHPDLSWISWAQCGSAPSEPGSVIRLVLCITSGKDIKSSGIKILCFSPSFSVCVYLLVLYYQWHWRVAQVLQFKVVVSNVPYLNKVLFCQTSKPIGNKVVCTVRDRK